MPDETSGTELSDAAPPPPRARQLWLIPPPRPLVERFGHAFFRALPREPGVYFFFDRDDRLIYVGKAKCLRQRLGSYRHVRPDRDSRKTWRLVNQVRQIRWELCADHEAALLRENRLLREFRPRFNRANVWPWSAVYFGLRADTSRHSLRVSRELAADHEWFGAFKAFAIGSFHALRRLVQDSYDQAATPMRHFESVGGREFTFTTERLDADQLKAFLRGDSRALLDQFESHALHHGGEHLARQNLVLNDLVTLEDFYERGPKRNRLLDAKGSLLTPEELSDRLAVRAA